jgi:hypothetical protein
MSSYWLLVESRLSHFFAWAGCHFGGQSSVLIFMNEAALIPSPGLVAAGICWCARRAPASGRLPPPTQAGRTLGESLRGMDGAGPRLRGRQLGKLTPRRPSPGWITTRALVESLLRETPERAGEQATGMPASKIALGGAQAAAPKAGPGRPRSARPTLFQFA